jgi:hypothetical protein
MKCRFVNGKRSIVVSSNRSGVAILAAVLQDVPDVYLFAVCTEANDGNNLWTTLWYRKSNRDAVLNRQLHGMPALIAREMVNWRNYVKSPFLSLRDLSVDIEIP